MPRRTFGTLDIDPLRRPGVRMDLELKGARQSPPPPRPPAPPTVRDPGGGPGGNPGVTLGQMVRTARVKHGLSLEQYAGSIRVSQTYLSQVEENVRVPTKLILRDIAQSLDLDLGGLIRAANRRRAPRMRPDSSRFGYSD